jgi:hypothetical protein
LKHRAILLLPFLALTPAASGQASLHALRFFGTGVGPPGQQDRARIPIDDNTAGPDASTPCDVGAGDFTIEFWIRGNAGDNTSANSGAAGEYFDNRWISGNIVVDRDIWGASNRDWGVSIAGGRMRFGTGRADSAPLDGEHTLEGGVAVLDGQWRHIACVREAATGVKRIYVDGAPDTASAANRSRDDISYPNAGDSAPQTPWGPYIVLAAEKHDAGAAYPSFNGFFDELRVWSVARTPAEIAATYNRVIAANTPGLAGYYRFEEGAGTTLADSSAAASPAGTLIAGTPGNGQWVARASDPLNTAPVIPDGPPPPQALLELATLPPGLPLLRNGSTVATPFSASFPTGSVHALEAPATAVLGGTTFVFRAWSDRGARAHGVTLPDTGLSLRAGYYAAAQAVATNTVAAADRGAESHPTEGIVFANAFDALALCAGRDDGGVYQAAMAFALPVPRGAEILSARLRLRPTADNQGSPAWSVRAYDLDTVPVFVSAGSGTLAALHPLTAVSVPWSPPMFTAGVWVESPDLSGLVSNVTARAGWNPGQFFALVIDGTASPLNAWRCCNNFASGNPPQLVVAYRTAGQDDPDLDDDGIDDAWELARGLDCTLAADAVLDPDSDGHATWREYVADTDPLDAGEVLRATVLPPPVSLLVFPSSSNRVYQLQSAPAPSGIWTNLTAWLPGTGAPLQLPLPPIPTQSLFRLETRLE